MRRNSDATVLTLLSCLLLTGCLSLPGPTYLSPPNLNLARTYVLEHYQTPVEYVISKFQDHDLVFLGEFHRLRHDPLLVQRLLPALDARGVKILVMEFANYEDQERIDRLVTAPRYDESLARSICLNSFLSIGLGGYQEYCDIFRAAWVLNQSLGEGESPFRILGVNNNNDWSVLTTPGDADDPKRRAQAFRGQTENDWAERVLTEVVAKNQKALVYSGIHHAFTRYRQPIVERGVLVGTVQTRFGNLLYDKLRNRTFTIFLHAPWSPQSGYDSPQMVLPADGAMDYLLARLPRDKRSFGADVVGTPLGEFTGKSGIYSSGYKSFRLSDYCDGYICQGLLTEYQAVTAIPDFINAENHFFVQSHFPNPWFRNASVATLNGTISEDADVYRRIFRNGLRDAQRIYAARQGGEP